MNAIDAQNDPISRRAGEWLLELQAGDVPLERIIAWQRWLAASEKHARAFDELQRTWNGVDQISAVPWPTEDEVAADRYEPSQDISSWQAEHRTAARRVCESRRRTWQLPSIAAGATLAIIAVAATVTFGWWLWPVEDLDSLIVETPVGEHRDVLLSDGSKIAVGAGSRLQVVMRPEARAVELERGEAFFQVAKDPSRPFRVLAGSTAVTAVGTAFNVRHIGKHVVVAVSEGTVAVSSSDPKSIPAAGAAEATRLTVGQKLVLEPEALTSPNIEVVPPAAVASWREGRLQYSGEPLALVIADVNRYRDEPILVDDPSVGALRVTGTVSEANIESWLISLQTALPVEVVARNGGGLEVRRRR